MNLRGERIKVRCAMLLNELTESGIGDKAPSPEHKEETVLACAVLSLTHASVERNKDADHITAICAALVNITRDNKMELHEALDEVACRMVQIWSANETGRTTPS